MKSQVSATFGDECGRKLFLAVSVGCWDDAVMALISDRRTDHLRRLAALVTQRRAMLGWSMEKAATEAGVAYMTYQRVERAQRVQSASYAKIEKALGFTPGSCRAVLDGATSIALLDGSEIVEGGRLTPLKPEEIDSEIRDAAASATIATLPELTGDQIKALSETFVEELRRRGIINENS